MITTYLILILKKTMHPQKTGATFMQHLLVLILFDVLISPSIISKFLMAHYKSAH